MVREPCQAGSGCGSGPWPPSFPTIFQALFSSFLGESVSQPKSFQKVSFPFKSAGICFRCLQHHENTTGRLDFSQPRRQGHCSLPAHPPSLENPVSKEHGVGRKWGTGLKQQSPLPSENSKWKRKKNKKTNNNNNNNKTCNALLEQSYPRTKEYAEVT